MLGGIVCKGLVVLAMKLNFLFCCEMLELNCKTGSHRSKKKYRRIYFPINAANDNCL